MKVVIPHTSHRTLHTSHLAIWFGLAIRRRFERATIAKVERAAEKSFTPFVARILHGQGSRRRHLFGRGPAPIRRVLLRRRGRAFQQGCALFVTLHRRVFLFGEWQVASSGIKGAEGGAVAGQGESRAAQRGSYVDRVEDQRFRSHLREK